MSKTILYYLSHVRLFSHVQILKFVTGHKLLWTAFVQAWWIRRLVAQLPVGHGGSGLAYISIYLSWVKTPDHGSRNYVSAACRSKEEHVSHGYSPSHESFVINWFSQTGKFFHRLVDVCTVPKVCATISRLPSHYLRWRSLGKPFPTWQVMLERSSKHWLGKK